MHSAILKFWFEELEPSQWWRVDHELDKSIHERFGLVHHAACAGELFEWRDLPEGRLAEIIVLDQFSRNIYRGTPLAFASDPMALALSQEAVRAGADQALSAQQRAFMYIPYMHSESAAIHLHAERLFRTQAPEANHKAELQHKAIIDRFGRYPHRNTILGRRSTQEERMRELRPSHSVKASPNSRGSGRSTVTRVCNYPTTTSLIWINGDRSV